MMRAHYISELQAVRRNLVQMGETTIALLGEAMRSVSEPSSGISARASELEAQTDHQHRLIHDQCLNLITLQAPVAGDARLVTGVLDAIVDLELIGDYSYEIVTLSMGMPGRPPSQITNQVAEVGGRIRTTLGAAIECWRTGDRDVVSSLKAQETSTRAECRTVYDKLSQLVAAPVDSSIYVDLMLISRHLERIMRHAICVADQAAEAAPASGGN